MAYQFCNDLGVWTREGAETTFAYSDGDDVETRIRDIILAAQDRSCFSPELQSQIVDWPTDYHLSYGRHHLLRHLPLERTTRVLELGCGCGAITRYLGEQVKEVVAVDGSLRRASIAAARCQDLGNVNVFCDRIDHFETTEEFDVILIIGVLEYAPCFVEGPHPAESLLQSALRYLKREGRMVIAIENQLGLKYLCGAPEDHAGRAFVGVQGLYGSRQATTWGRQALTRLLQNSGLQAQQFLYPFPDYKHPQLLVTEEALQHSLLNVSDLVSNYTRDHQPHPLGRSFDEALAWAPVVENGLLPALANSFLVEASRVEPEVGEKPDWLAISYGSPRRWPAFATETRFSVTEGPRIRVSKSLIAPPVSGPSQNPRQFVHRLPGDTPYFPGQPLMLQLRTALSRDREGSSVITGFRLWLDFLLSHCLASSANQLPGDFVDCTPANLLVDQGRPVYIDAEWGCHTSIPLNWVFLRGCCQTLVSPHSIAWRVLTDGTLGEAILAIAEALGMPMARTDLLDAAAWEDDFSTYALSAPAPPLGGLLDQPLQTAIPPDRLFALAGEANALQQEIRRVKGTRSWRFTGPFRGIWNQFHRLGSGGKQT